jgi:transposase
MSRTFTKVDHEQLFDVTVRPGDCLPSDHLARSVIDRVAQLDLSALCVQYGSSGGKPYAPERLLSLLLYGWATGVFSSRKLLWSRNAGCVREARHRAIHRDGP